ncbi:MAG: FHA domain-containing protein [Myxococcota bacterium]
MIRTDTVQLEQPLGAEPLTVGRSPRSGLMLADPTVSWHHAMVWVEADKTWVRDLRSSNGTFVGEQRIDGQHELRVGDQLRFGTVVTQIEPAHTPAPTPTRSYCLEDLHAGVSYALIRDRFRIGPGGDLDLRDAPDTVMLIVHPDEIRLVRGEADAPLDIGGQFTVGGRVFRLAELAADKVPTVTMAPSTFPYRLEVALDGPTGPWAMLSDLVSGARFQADSGNRAVLLWFLARRYAEQGEVRHDDRGWCSDGEVQTALWGRSGDANKLDVLLYRLRSDLKKVGFDPWFIEKRNRHLRARLAEVAVRDEPR